MEGFWKMWKCKLGDKSPLPECVDGISDRSLIAGLFAKKFEEACKPNTQEQYKYLKQEFDVKYNSYVHLSYSPLGWLLLLLWWIE